MFLDEINSEKNLEKKTEEIPEDPFKGEIFVVYNKFGRFSDEEDKLMYIIFRRYGPINPGDNVKKWKYTGIIFEMKATNSLGLPIIPFESKMEYEIPQNELTTSRNLRTY